jgi:Exopolysaccharide synthesis, ExoD
MSTCKASYTSHSEARFSGSERTAVKDGCSTRAFPAIDPPTPTSKILQDLLLHASDETVALGWLMRELGPRSFGIILLLLGLLACLPGVSAVAGVLIAIPHTR